MNDIRLILVDPKTELCNAFREQFQHFSNVEIVVGRFEQLSEFDCMVSAANSFGLMDGGVDYAITQFFGDSLQSRVQQRIIAEFLGEQPVGTSIIVETDNPKHPYIAHTPTMRVPMAISRTDNVYIAMWSMLLAVRQHNLKSNKKINIVACSGLGTATGRVDFQRAAWQMALAYENFLKPPSYIDWRYADQRQERIKLGGDMGLTFPPDMKLS